MMTVDTKYLATRLGLGDRKVSAAVNSPSPNRVWAYSLFEGPHGEPPNVWWERIREMGIELPMFAFADNAFFPGWSEGQPVREEIDKPFFAEFLRKLPADCEVVMDIEGPANGGSGWKCYDYVSGQGFEFYDSVLLKRVAVAEFAHQQRPDVRLASYNQCLCDTPSMLVNPGEYPYWLDYSRRMQPIRDSLDRLVVGHYQVSTDFRYPNGQPVEWRSLASQVQILQTKLGFLAETCPGKPRSALLMVPDYYNRWQDPTCEDATCDARTFHLLLWAAYALGLSPRGGFDVGLWAGQQRPGYSPRLRWDPQAEWLGVVEHLIEREGIAVKSPWS